MALTTVKPPNKGHIGDGAFVPCREVVFYWKVIKDKKLTPKSFKKVLLQYILCVYFFSIARWQEQYYLHENAE